MLGVYAITLGNRHYYRCRIQEQERRHLHPPQVSSKFMIYLSISFLIKKCMVRWLTEVIISCMAQLGRRVPAMMALSVSGSIFLYSSAWNDASLSGLDNCTNMLLWKAHTILANQINASYISSALTVPPSHRGSMLEIALLYSCLVADQTVAICVKSLEWLMLSPHALQASYHWGYAVLVQNTWVIRCLKERGTKRDKGSRVNIYATKRFFNSNEGYFQGSPTPF